MKYGERMADCGNLQNREEVSGHYWRTASWHQNGREKAHLFAERDRFPLLAGLNDPQTVFGDLARTLGEAVMLKHLI